MGYYLADTCHHVVGDLEHLLLFCPALQQTRTSQSQMWLVRSAAIPQLQDIVLEIFNATPGEQLQFILDPMSIPAVLSLTQLCGYQAMELVFYMTRTFAYNIHRRKEILAGRWPYANQSNYITCTIDMINYENVAGTHVTRRPTDGGTVHHVHQGDKEQQPSNNTNTSTRLTSVNNCSISDTYTTVEQFGRGHPGVTPDHDLAHVGYLHSLPVHCVGGAGLCSGLSDDVVGGSILASLLSSQSNTNN
jgi:hypothetical protein